MFVARLTAICIAILLLAASLQRPAFAQAASADELDAFRQQVTTAWGHNDIEALTNLFSEDAVFFTQFGDTLEGRAQIRSWLMSSWPTTNLVIDPLRDDSIGNSVLEVGNFVQDATADGKPLEYHGGYAILVVRGEGNLLMHRLIAYPERKPLNAMPN